MQRISALPNARKWVRTYRPCDPEKCAPSSEWPASKSMYLYFLTVAIKLRIPKSNTRGRSHFFGRDPVLRSALLVFVLLATVSASVFTYYYIQFDRIIDQRFKGQVFSNSAKIYAIPHAVHVGEKVGPKEVAAELRHAGYTDKDGQSLMGSYRLLEGGIEIRPGPDSYHSPEPATIRIREGKVEAISSKTGDLEAYELEQKFSKQQIFEFYANRVDLGQRGSFTISGFAEASRAYFNKDLKDISVAEAALIAGLIQAPSYLSPYRHPERALERRNLVLDSMVETHAITKADAEKAKATPLKLAPPNVEASDAPYFVDLVRETLISKLDERQMNDQSYRIYTTLDPELQRAAAQAVEAGMKLVDEQVKKLRTKRIKIGKNKYETKVQEGPEAQVALVAMDPHTGEVLALVGGRNYGFSQLNHVLAKRPTGSIFKPFVYAAAVNTGLDGSNPVLTPASMVEDQPSTFAYGDQIYEPRNYKEEYHGEVTMRYALAMSLNNATVKLAEQVGYDKVADLAKAAGITSVKATPAMALGAYEATPLDMTSAYTVFANGGVHLSPVLVNSVRNTRGDVVMDFNSEKRQVLDPRVAFVTTNLMESVINNGLAVGAVRGRGFSAPAAGKTGSSHDGWFAGYTSNLLCIVWVGYDDYSDLRLSGAQTAAPIWTEFMKKAVALPQYSDVKPFSQPAGVVDVQLDKQTNLLATPSCPETYSSAFIAGTEPSQTCDQGTGVRGFFSRIFGLGGEKALPPPPPGTQPGTVVNTSGEDPKKKKGFFGKIAGIFKEDKSSNNPPPKPADNGSKPQ